jgi:hypothetical protein
MVPVMWRWPPILGARIQRLGIRRRLCSNCRDCDRRIPDRGEVRVLTTKVPEGKHSSSRFFRHILDFMGEVELRHLGERWCLECLED